jgi:hypothetical protein
VRLVEQLGLPELTSEQVEELSLLAEEATRKHVLSKVPLKKVEWLNISTQTESAKSIALDVQVDVTLVRSMQGFDVQQLADEAVRQAFVLAEEYLRRLVCPSHK